MNAAGESPLVLDSPSVYKTIGGAQIGWMNASWPLAKLTADAKGLTLFVTVFGTYRFESKDVVAIREYHGFTLFSTGIQIIHNKTDYPGKIIFWNIVDRSTVLKRFRELGLPTGVEEVRRDGRKGFALRWPVVIGAILIWNILGVLDYVTRPKNSAMNRPGLFACVALLLAFLFSAAALMSPRVQVFVLRPGRSIGEAAPLLRFVAVISFLLGVLFTIKHF